MKGGAGSFMQVKELTEEETTGQGNIGERGNYCWLATSVDCSSGRKFDRVQLSQARTQELDLGRKKVSGEAGWLGGSACPFIGRRSEGATATCRKVSG